MKKSRIGILTGGGDCAGLNPAIKWVVKTATDDRLQAERGVQYEVIGIRDGWQGLVQADPSRGDSQEWLTPLDQNAVRTWDRFGGTMLGTSRTNPYNPKNDQSKKVLENIEKLRLDLAAKRYTPHPPEKKEPPAPEPPGPAPVTPTPVAPVLPQIPAPKP